ncbi:MAG: CvpA family protein [Lachnospiraceae bacterium]|nr:CvpA family protein [Lachnospiraceae bacterium]
MNVTLIGFIILMLVMVSRGFKKGMVKEITGLISLAVTLFVVSLIIMLYTSFHAEETENMLVTVIILVVVSLIYSLVKIFLKSAKLLSKLPVIKLLDRFLGLFVGAAKGMIILWIIYILNEGNLFGPLTEQIVKDTMNSDILMKIYEYNYLMKLGI